MPAASWAQTSFLGGERSKTAQGRFDDPAYEIALNVCLNSLPIEAGAWTRRPGFGHAGTTRNGAPGRVVGFNFKQAAPYTVEYTDGHIRFRSGTSLVTSNDSVGVVSVSTASPAVVQTAAAVTWATGDQAYFSGLGTTAPRLQNRVFALTKSNTTHFALADALTGLPIDGSTLAWAATAGATLNRVLDIATPYIAGAWSSLRAVQTDLPLVQGSTPAAVLLQGSVAPYVLQVTAAPTATAFAAFSLAPVPFKDGPYFDPVPNGVLATPTATIGNITVTLQFNAYDASRSYAIGDYVTASSVNYKSLTDANLGNTPASSASNWLPVSVGDALSGGFTPHDIGRLIRLLSEPNVWAAGTTYSAGNQVTYGGSGLARLGATYWTAVASSTGVIPGTDTTKWAVSTNAARWTWGKITGLSNVIAASGPASFGDHDAGGGTGAGVNSAAFDGILSKVQSACAVHVGNSAQPSPSYCGQSYAGTSDQQISQAIVYPSTDQGFVIASKSLIGIEKLFTVTIPTPAVVTLNLRGKASFPANSADGTLLGTTGAFANQLTPVVITSSDQVTSWKYVWVEMVVTFTDLSGNYNGIVWNVLSWFDAQIISQIQFFSPTGSGTSTGITVQVLGDPLLTTNAIRVWRLGVFDVTTGFPTCGTYHEDGRLWLSGVVPNRIDSSRSNDPFNMAPTDPDGSVPANAAISYIFNSKDINPILWMESDDRGIICGTQGAEWLVTATTQNLPLSPTNIQAHPVTHYGSENIEPRRAGGPLVFVQRYGRKLLEYFADVFSGRLTAPNLTRDSKHLTKTALQEIAYQSELVPVLWARRGDGTLVGWTYKRENLMSSQGPAFNGGHVHALGSGRRVESICTGPSVGGALDALTIVTNDPASGVRHVEVMHDLFDEGDPVTSAWFLDDAVAPSSYTYDLNALTVTLNGLWHLNGATVTAFVAGLDAGDYAVANGSITVKIDGTANRLLTADYVQPYLAALPAVVGFTYDSDGQVLRGGPQKDSGAANGPAFGKVSRAHQIAVLLQDTGVGLNGTAAAGLSFGSFFTATMKWPALVRATDQSLVPAGQLFSGVFWTPADNPYSFDEGQLCWRIGRPYPATIAAFSAFQMTQDR